MDLVDRFNELDVEGAPSNLLLKGFIRYFMHRSNNINVYRYHMPAKALHFGTMHPATDSQPTRTNFA